MLDFSRTTWSLSQPLVTKKQAGGKDSRSGPEANVLIVRGGGIIDKWSPLFK